MIWETSISHRSPFCWVNIYMCMLKESYVPKKYRGPTKWTPLILPGMVKIHDERVYTWESFSESLWMASGHWCPYRQAVLSLLPFLVHLCQQTVVCCFLLSASSRAVPGDVRSSTNSFWIWLQMHIKGSLKEEKKWKSRPANCLKDEPRRGVKRLILLQAASGALSLDEPKFMQSTTICEYNNFPLLCLRGSKLWGQGFDSFNLEHMITWRVLCPTLVLQNRRKGTEVKSKSNKQREQTSAAFAREHIWLCCFAIECLKIFTSL